MSAPTDPCPPEPGKLALPVPTRTRHDGWTPEKQHDFIAALAESGCIKHAAKSVGMTAASAYKLRARPDASHFRQAWDIALDFAVRMLSEAAFSRALHGVSTPVFYQGEQIGERRKYDERLTMFLLRYRDPVRFGAWLDGYEARRHPDGAGIVLAHALNAVMDSAHGFDPEPEPGEAERGEFASATALPRALAEGPVLAVTGDDQEEFPDHWDEEMRDLKRVFNARFRENRDAWDEDPTVEDWREPLTVRRPRNPPKFGS